MKKGFLLMLLLVSIVYVNVAFVFAKDKELPETAVLPQDWHEAYALMGIPKTITSASAFGVYEYMPRGRRDPFMPLVVKPKEVEPKEVEPKKEAIPLKRYDVTEFKLIAILLSEKRHYALVTLPDGKSYTITEGIKLGLREGKVYKITKDSVTIKEQIRDQRGILMPRDTILKLRKGEEG